MKLSLVLPYVSTAIMLVFSISVFQRWLARRKPHFLFWSIGLAMFGAGSFAEAYFAGVGWSPTVFFVWYFFGAMLNAAWIGHGTLLLLFRKRWTRVVTGVLIVGSLVALLGMLNIMPRVDASSFTSSLPISEQYPTILPAIDQGGTIRLATIPFNVYGLLTLAGGALWSAWLFLRKQVLPNRVLGNVLIAAGALSIGFASAMTRFGIGDYLYLGELAAAILIYAGFVLAGKPATKEELAAQQSAATASA